MSPGDEPRSGTGGQGGQVLAKRGIEPFDKRGIQDTSSFRLGQERLSSFQAPLGHASNDLNNAPLFRVFDHRSDQQVWPGDERGSPSSYRAFDLFVEYRKYILSPALCQPSTCLTISPDHAILSTKHLLEH